MVDFQNPAVIEKDFMVVVKLWHVLNGVFIWEFLITLNYEWDVIRGRRPYRWTTWIYTLTRVFTLLAVALNMLGFDSSSRINCQLWVIFELIFAYSAFACASLLVILRIIAIWDGNRIAVAIAICSLGNNIGFFIYNTSLIRSIWEPTQSICGVLNSQITAKTIVAVLISDVILLLTMLVGLLRLRIYGTMFGLVLFLWKQGLIWLFFATAAELPPAVFGSLNLNYPFNLMFQTPALVVMTIGATRIHRSLVDYTSSSSRDIDICPAAKGRTGTADPKRNFGARFPLNRVEVVLRQCHETYPLTNAVGQNGADTSSQSQDRPSIVLDISNDPENGVIKG